MVKKPGAEVTRDELLAFYEGKIAKWWMPDDVVFVDAIPLGATGKMQKTKLREQFKRLQAAHGIAGRASAAARGPSSARVLTIGPKAKQNCEIGAAN